MLLFGWHTHSDDEPHTLSHHARHLIEDLHIGGLILMGRNVGTKEATRQTIAEAQQIAKANNLPRLFMATDQEGGRVARFCPPYYPSFPSAKELAESGSADRARANAAGIGDVLKDVGINWPLMPVLDVNNNPGNEVIGDRSFGDNPEIVAKLGVASILGMQNDAGLMACGKHFPGHGDTDVDSHLALPTIKHTMSRLENVEIPPFCAAISANVASIMTSHILFPDLDPNLPATLSPAIITGLLRKTLGYDGVVITDCLEMHGVAKKWGSAEAAVLAAIAGADVLLACHTETTQNEIQQALLKAFHTGRLTEARINEANRRVARAKAKWLA
jgi:beta-N-acetylhexosaminidase